MEPAIANGSNTCGERFSNNALTKWNTSIWKHIFHVVWLFYWGGSIFTAQLSFRDKPAVGRVVISQNFLCQQKSSYATRIGLVPPSTDWSHELEEEGFARRTACLAKTTVVGRKGKKKHGGDIVHHIQISSCPRTQTLCWQKVSPK